MMDLISYTSSWNEINQNLSKYFVDDIDKQDLMKGIKNIVFTKKPKIFYVDSFTADSFECCSFLWPGENDNIYIVFKDTITNIPANSLSHLVGSGNMWVGDTYNKIYIIFKHDATALANLTINATISKDGSRYHYIVPTGMTADYLAKFDWTDADRNLISEGSEQF